MRDNEMKLAKVKKSCAISKKVVNVLKVIMLVFLILCAIAAVVVLGFRNQINAEMPAAIANGNVNFDVSDININGIIDLSIPVEMMLERGNYAGVYALTCGYGAGACAIIFAIFATLVNVFKTIEGSDTPFCDLVLSKIKKTFILLVVMTALFTGLGFAAVLGLSFWCVYRIFEYGVALQNEVDETL